MPERIRVSGAAPARGDIETWIGRLRALAVDAGYDADSVDFRLVARCFLWGWTPEETFADMTGDESPSSNAETAAP